MAQKLMKGNKEAGKGLYKLYKSKPEVVEKMGYKMVMGMKEIDSPSSFSSKQSEVMQMAPLGPMLNTHDENGVNPVDTSGFQVVDQISDAYVGQQGGVQGIFTDLNTTLEKRTEGTEAGSGDPSVLPPSTEAFNNPAVPGQTYQEFIDAPCGSPGKPFTNPMCKDEKPPTEGSLEQKQETERTFQAAPTRDVLSNFEARQAQRNVGQAFRKAKRSAIQEERANLRKDIKGSDLTKEERKAKRKAFRDRKREIKANAKKYAALGKRQVAQDVLNQTLGGRTQSQTRSENVKYDADGKPIGFEEKNLVTLMKPMQFRKKY